MGIFRKERAQGSHHEQDRIELVESIGVCIPSAGPLKKIRFLQQAELGLHDGEVDGSKALHVGPRDDGADIDDGVLFFRSDAHAPSEAVQTWDGFGLHVHAKDAREGDG